MKGTLFVKNAFGNVILLLLFVSRLTAQNNESVTFMHVSDIHLIFNIELYQRDLANSRMHYANGVELFELFLNKKPAETDASFVVATGDMIDFYQGESGNRKMLNVQVEQFAQKINKSEVPVYCVLGNHDIAAYSWDGNTRNSTQNVAGIARSAWIRNASCFYEGTYYSKMMKVGRTNYRLIFLDDSYNDNRENENMIIPYMSIEQLHWLKDQFDERDDDVEIVMMHIPLDSEKIGSTEEENIYSVLKRQSSLKLLLVGHNHENEIKEIVGLGGKFYQVMTGAFARDPENWRVIELTENTISVSLPGKTGQEIKIPIK